MMNLVAHRGHASEYPENTLPALQSAISLGLHFIEFDVHLCADEIPVVIHDDSLSRTAGIEGSVFAFTAAQLSAVEVNETARLGPRFKGVCIPLLTDVVRLLKQHPAVTAFVEIKRASLRHFGTDKVVAKVLQTIEPVKAQCVVISFDFPALELVQARGHRVGWVLTAYDTASREQSTQLKPQFLFCNHEKLPLDGSPLWPGSWQWALYEIDDAPLAKRLAQRGAHLIETMAAAAMTEALRDDV